MADTVKALALAAAILVAAWILVPMTAMLSACSTPHSTLEGFAYGVVDLPEDEASVTSHLNPEPVVEETIEDEWYVGDYYEPAYYESDYSGDGFMQEGVRAGVDSDTETWYSSNVAYHYRTSEWTPDDEGYYRDADGYYVVASDDYPEGTVVTTSKGEAKVYDSGTDSGNIDMYVAW